MAQDPEGFDFESQWPQLEAHVRGLLGRYRVPAALRDDIVQETGARLWKLRGHVDPARPIQALAGTIALNLLRDHARKEQHLSSGVDMADMIEPRSLEDEVIARDELRLAASAWHKLSSEYRRVLATSIRNDPSDARTPASGRMMKMRARKQLRRLMDDISRSKAGCGLLLHKIGDGIAARVGRSRSFRTDHLSHVAGAAAVLLTLSVPPADRVVAPRAADVPAARTAPPDGDGSTQASNLSAADISDDYPIIVAARDRTKKAASERRRKTFLRVGPVAYYEGDSAVSGTLVVHNLDEPLLRTPAGVVPSVDVEKRLRRGSGVTSGLSGTTEKKGRNKS